MNNQTVLFKSGEPRTMAEAARFLRQLAAKIERGKVTLRQSGKNVVLPIPLNLMLEVKAEEETNGKKATTRSLKVELEWIEVEEESTDSKKLSFSQTACDSVI